MAPVFMLSELKQMFTSAYHRYTGTEIELHGTRFKKQLLSRIPGLQTHKQGKQIVLMSDYVATGPILAAFILWWPEWFVLSAGTKTYAPRPLWWRGKF